MTQPIEQVLAKREASHATPDDADAIIEHTGYVVRAIDIEAGMSIEQARALATCMVNAGFKQVGIFRLTRIFKAGELK